MKAKIFFLVNQGDRWFYHSAKKEGRKCFRTIFSHNGRCLIFNDFVSAEMMREAEHQKNLHEREHEHEGEVLHFFDNL